MARYDRLDLQHATRSRRTYNSSRAPCTRRTCVRSQPRYPASRGKHPYGNIQGQNFTPCFDMTIKHLKVCSPANTLRFPALRFSFPYPILSVISIHRNQHHRTGGGMVGERYTIVRIIIGDSSIPTAEASNDHVKSERKVLDQPRDRLNHKQARTDQSVNTTNFLSVWMGG